MIQIRKSKKTTEGFMMGKLTSEVEVIAYAVNKACLGDCN